MSQPAPLSGVRRRAGRSVAHPRRDRVDRRAAGPGRIVGVGPPLSRSGLQRGVRTRSGCCQLPHALPSSTSEVPRPCGCRKRSNGGIVALLVQGACRGTATTPMPPVPLTPFCVSVVFVQVQRSAAIQGDAAAIAIAVIAGDRAVGESGHACHRGRRRCSAKLLLIVLPVTVAVPASTRDAAGIVVGLVVAHHASGSASACRCSDAGTALRRRCCRSCCRPRSAPPALMPPPLVEWRYPLPPIVPVVTVTLPEPENTPPPYSPPTRWRRSCSESRIMPPGDQDAAFRRCS